MPIPSSDIKLCKSATVTDTSANGGRRGRQASDVVTSGTLGNFFDPALPEELAAGSVKYRKGFVYVANDDDLPLYSALLYLDAPTAAEDRFTWFVGTARDTLADHSSPRRYGCASLAADVGATATTLIVEVEAAADTGIFVAGDEIVITDKVTPTSLTGSRVVREIDAITDVTGTQVTMTLTAQIGTAFTVAGNTRVASGYRYGNITTTSDSWAETFSGDASYDEASYPLTLDHLGTIEQTWTLTWSDATTFSCVGDTVGSVGSGTVGADFAPVNSLTGKPYFTLAAAGHGGTHSALDELTFVTHGPEFSFFAQRDLPAGSSTSALNRATMVLLGATA